MNLPFLTPRLFEPERDALVKTLFEVGTAPEQRFILGERTARLEREIREMTGAGDVIACGSGTAALTLALHALRVGPGDEVIVPAFSCQPVASTVVGLGATPVFADVDPETLVIDPDEVERLITDHTRAIVPAHVFSVMADMPRLCAIARRRDLDVVEDAAVAQGAALGGVPAARWGNLGMYSFFPIKAFGTAGEGGAVLTDDPDLATAVRMLRNHGQDGRHRFVHHRIGYNSRFDEVLAGFWLHLLPAFSDRLERRAWIADYYTERFLPLRERGLLPPPPGRDGHCFYVYSLLAERRNELAAHLRDRGIGTSVHYPVPLPRQPAFARFAPAGRTWPNAERASRRNLAIPFRPDLTDDQVAFIADSVSAFFDRPSTGPS